MRFGWKLLICCVLIILANVQESNGLINSVYNWFVVLPRWTPFYRNVQIYIKTNPSLRDDRYSGNNLYMEKLDKVSNDFKAFVLTQHDNQKADKKADQKEKTKSSDLRSKPKDAYDSLVNSFNLYEQRLEVRCKLPNAKNDQFVNKLRAILNYNFTEFLVKVNEWNVSKYLKQKKVAKAMKNNGSGEVGKMRTFIENFCSLYKLQDGSKPKGLPQGRALHIRK